MTQFAVPGKGHWKRSGKRSALPGQRDVSVIFVPYEDWQEDRTTKTPRHKDTTKIPMLEPDHYHSFFFVPVCHGGKRSLWLIPRFPCETLVRLSRI